MGPPLCAICADRVATTLDHIDGRSYPVCLVCRDAAVPTPASPPSMRERALAALRRMPGADIVEIAQALGQDDAPGRARVSAALARAIKAGLVTYVGRRMDRMYTLAERT